MVNIKDIARMAGLSISTVSKVINNKTDDLSQETVDKVLRIVKEYNYTPYGRVRTPKKTKTFNIAVLLKNMDNATHFVSELTRVFRKEGYTLLLYNSDNNLEYEKSNLSKLANKNIDGLLWEPIVDSDDKTYREILSQNTYKTLLFNTDDNSKVNFDIDYKKMAYIATQKLIDKGHTDITCIYKDKSVRGAKTLQGYRECLLDNGINKENKVLFSNNIDVKNFDLNGQTAILSSHYTASKFLTQYIRSLNYSVPLDISIVSLRGDNINFFENFEISHLEIPFKSFANFIATKLIDYIENGNLSYDNFNYDYKLSSERSISIPRYMTDPSILVVGSINLDNLIFLDDFPTAGSVQIANKNIKIAGGKALNQAIGLNRLHKNVKLLGKIGSDEASDLIIDKLRSEGVSYEHIIRDKKLSTGTASVIIKESGESSIFLSGEANNSFKNLEILDNEDLFKNISFTLVQTEIPEETAIQAILLAKKHESYTIVKPAAIKNIDDRVYPYIDIIVPNFNEAVTLTGSDNPEEQAKYFLDKGVKVVIITMDKDGSYLRTTDQSKHFNAYETKVIDETGASDAFISALCSKLADGESLENAIIAGNLAASYSISNFGVADALIDYDTLERYIELNSN